MKFIIKFCYYKEPKMLHSQIHQNSVSSNCSVSQKRKPFVW